MKRAMPGAVLPEPVQRALLRDLDVASSNSAKQNSLTNNPMRQGEGEAARSHGGRAMSPATAGNGVYSGGGDVGGMSGRVAAMCRGEPGHAIIGSNAGVHTHSFRLSAETMSEPPLGKCSDAFPMSFQPKVVEPTLLPHGINAIEGGLGHFGAR